MIPPILLVDDDPAMLRLMEFELGEACLPVVTAKNAAECFEVVERVKPSCVLLDLGLPDADGKDVLERLKERRPDLPIIVVTGSDEVAVAVECMRLGASDFLQKPFVKARLIASARNAHEAGVLRRRLRDLESQCGEHGIIGESAAITKTRRLTAKAARAETSILIYGESGTGKELFARAVHQASHRASGPFVAVNCAAIPESLMESQLFGHVRGAFTGASSNRAGLFQEASGGTIFLDEIGELPYDLQARLLRVLQEREIRPVGSDKVHAIDVRIVVATNRNLKDEIGAGNFREDLYYRLSVFPIEIPPLRERNGDVELLASHFLETFNTRSAATTKPGTFASEAMAALQAYPWPGNVRELENAVERAVILEEGQQITLSSLPDHVVCAAYDPHEEGHETSADSVAATSAGTNGRIATMEEEERRIFLSALEKNLWNVRSAAAALGIGRATLYRRIQSFGLEAEEGELKRTS